MHHATVRTVFGTRNRQAAAGQNSGDLADRAVHAVSAVSGGLTDGALAEAVFGANAGASWAPMLSVLFASDERIIRRDGLWQLAQAGTVTANTGPPARVSSDVAVADVAGSILALALATTGADPAHHRLRRLSLVALQDGEVVARFDAAVAREADGADGAHGWTDESEDALYLHEVVEHLRPLTDGQTVYVYGARRAQAFIDAELRRADLPPLPMSLRESDDLLRAHLPPDRKPGLVAAARELGLPYRRPGVPLADAEALARVIERLRQRQGASPARPADAPYTTSSGGDAPPSPSGLPLAFTREWLAGVPDGPGVYVFEDGNGRALYVGKARSLYRRLGDYVRQQPGANRKLEALAVRAAAVRTHATPSDLEATLLEARLISLHQPEFNVAREARPPLTVIRAGPDEASPRLQLVAEFASDGARYFGPCESNRTARAALETVRAVYPAAFSRKRADVAAQRQAVLDACRLLSGQKTPALALLRELMQVAAARGEQLEVDRLRAALKAVQVLDVRPSLLVGLPAGAQVLVLEQVFEGVTRTHLVEDGRRLVSVGWDIDYLPTDPHRLRQLAASMLAARESAGDSTRTTGEIDEDVSMLMLSPDPNESALVMRWLVQSWERVEIARIPTPDVPATPK